MRDFRLEFRPFSFVALHEGKICRKPNEHTTAYVKGMIGQDNVQAYLGLISENRHLPFSIIAITGDGKEIVIFEGVTTCPMISQVGGVATMTIEAKSGSYLMDRKKRFRTFLDANVLHSQILNLLGEPYADYNFILKTSIGDAIGRPSSFQSIGTKSEMIQDAPLGRFTVQYMETDWAFAKRLASRQNTFLVPADTHPGIRYYFGMPNTDGHILDDDIDFDMIRDYENHDEKIRQGLRDTSEADAICYVVRHREIFMVGDIVQYRGMRLFIDQITTELTGQELMHVYHLRPRSGLRVPTYYNENIIGASLDGHVIAIRNDRVQVQIRGDENVGQTIQQWFSYATPYSSPDGTGWYCMPERGDQIRLYMPDREEANAVVFNALHVTSSARRNPDVKSMRNRHGKEVRFTPNAIVMTDNAGSEVSIVDGEGVRVESSGDILMKADGNVDITSGANVSMLAGDSVVVQQGGTSLVVDDNIAFVGGRLDMQ